MEVRDGAHMFWWLYYADSQSAGYKDLPLVMWLQVGLISTDSLKLKGPHQCFCMFEGMYRSHILGLLIQSILYCLYVSECVLTSRMPQVSMQLADTDSYSMSWAVICREACILLKVTVLL